MQKTNQLTNQEGGKETHRHPLDEEKSLRRKVEERVSSYFADTRECVPDTSNARSAMP